jgi:anti-sigma regulatory factor (Ser/Thr protein kinase)
VATNPVGEMPVGDGPGDLAAPNATVRLAFPPQARLLGTIRLVVGIVARKAGIDEEGIEDLKVAVSETCAVAVADLARAELSSPIELDLIEDGERFGVEIRDRAPADGRKVGGFDMEDLDDRQFGLALVGALVDGLDTAPLEGGGHRTRFWVRVPAGTID